MEYIVNTQNTCAKRIKFTLKGNIVTNVEFLDGGCPGNLQALPKLVEGMSVQEIKNKLGNIMCGFRGTSCANELVKAVCEAYENSKQAI